MIEWIILIEFITKKWIISILKQIVNNIDLHMGIGPVIVPSEDYYWDSLGIILSMLFFLSLQSTLFYL